MNEKEGTHEVRNNKKQKTKWNYTTHIQNLKMATMQKQNRRNKLNQNTTHNNNNTTEPNLNKQPQK